MMKIIFLTYDLPYPLTSGGKIRAYQMLKALSTRYEVTLFSYIRREPKTQYLDELNKYCQEIRLFKRRKVWSLSHFLRAGFSLLPGAIAHYENPQLREELIYEIKEGGYSAVHFESFYTSLYLPEVRLTGVKTVLGTENIEYQLYRSFVDSLPFFSWPLKLFLYLDLGKMYRYEQKLWRLASRTIAVSDEEARFISQTSGKECRVVENGVDLELFSGGTRKSVGPPTILFVGNLKYLQNDRGIKKFLAEIFPLIKIAVPDLIVKIVSSHQPEWFRQYSGKVELIIDREKPFSYFVSEADVIINPVEIKGGTRIKVLEGLASGLPVVTFRSSLYGFDQLLPGRDLLAAETPEMFAAAVIKLLGDSRLRDKIGRNGRQVVENHYSWDKSLVRLLDIYQWLFS